MKKTMYIPILCIFMLMCSSCSTTQIKIFPNKAIPANALDYLYDEPGEVRLPQKKEWMYSDVVKMANYYDSVQLKTAERLIYSYVGKELIGYDQGYVFVVFEQKGEKFIPIGQYAITEFGGMFYFDGEEKEWYQVIETNDGSFVFASDKIAKEEYYETNKPYLYYNENLKISFGCLNNDIQVNEDQTPAGINRENWNFFVEMHNFDVYGDLKSADAQEKIASQFEENPIFDVTGFKWDGENECIIVGGNNFYKKDFKCKQESFELDGCFYYGIVDERFYRFAFVSKQNADEQDVKAMKLILTSMVFD